jgi:DNA polymerase III delta prime subunit
MADQPRENPFQPAVREAVRATIGIYGPSGAGKSTTALMIARGLVGAEGTIAAIDTEGGTLNLLQGLTPFDTKEMTPPFAPGRYAQGVRAAADFGYGACLVDSGSHAWEGEGGVKDIVDQATAADPKNNAYGKGWQKGNPEHQKLLGMIVRAPLHLVMTLRSKSEFALVNGQRKKIGLAPVQRDGLDYEFAVFLYMDTDHTLTVEKSRIATLPVGEVIPAGLENGVALGERIAAWLATGAQPTPAPSEATADGQSGQSAAPAEQAQPPVPPAAPAPEQSGQSDPLGLASPPPAESSADPIETGIIRREEIDARIVRLSDLRDAPDGGWAGFLQKNAQEAFGAEWGELDDANFAAFCERIDQTIATLAERKAAAAS